MEYLDSQGLVAAAPWLAKYGAKLLNVLAKCCISTLDDILSVAPDQLLARPGVGSRTCSLLEQAQEEFRQRRAGGDPAVGTGAPVLADSDLLDLPWVRRRYSTRLLNSLGRLGVRTPRDIMQLPPDDFARARGVGPDTVRSLIELQAELEAMLLGDSAIPPADAQAALSDAAPEAPLAVTAELVPPECAEIPVSRIWYVWDTMPTRLRNVLEANGVVSVADVMQLSPGQIASFRAAGKKTIADLGQLQDQLRDWVARQGGEPADADSVGTRCYNGEVAMRPEPSTLDSLLAQVVNSVCAAGKGAANAQRDGALWLGYFGVGAEEAQTLEELGAVHGISRERVRQIVRLVTRRVRHEFGANQTLAVLTKELDAFFARGLGVAEAAALTSTLRAAGGWEREPTPAAITALAEALQGSPHAFVPDPDRGLVRHVDMCQPLWQQATAQAANLLREMDEGVHLLDFAYRLSCALGGGCCSAKGRIASVVPCCGAGTGDVRLPESYVRAVLSTLDPNPLDGETVLSYWHAVLRNGRRKKQVVEAALRVLRRPTHFTALTEFLCANNPRFSPADESYVHGCLVNSDKYVVTGKLGTYGLREWGVEEYLTVADRVEEFLRQRGHPVAVRDIVRAFRAQGVSENNVRLCLNQARFSSDGGGAVGLTEWERAGKAGNGGESGGSLDLFIDDGDDGFIIG